MKSKYKNIDEEFDGELLKRNSSNELLILGERSFQINSSDLVDEWMTISREKRSGLLKFDLSGMAAKKIARARFFSDAVSSKGDVDFGWGNTTGYPDEFYSDQI